MATPSNSKCDIAHEAHKVFNRLCALEHRIDHSGRTPTAWIIQRYQLAQQLQALEARL